MDKIIKGLQANGITRSLAIQGGEPLCPENLPLTNRVITVVKELLPETKIYIWTGYIFEELQQERKNSPTLDQILNTIDVLIDGPYIEEERDITLPMRGSRNQRIINLKENNIQLFGKDSLAIKV